MTPSAKLTALFTEKANAEYFESQGYCTGKECLITGEHAWGVVKAGDADYDGIRNVCAHHQVRKVRAVTMTQAAATAVPDTQRGTSHPRPGTPQGLRTGHRTSTESIWR